MKRKKRKVMEEKRPAASKKRGGQFPSFSLCRESLLTV